MQTYSATSAARFGPAASAFSRPAAVVDIEVIGLAKSYARDQEIFGEGEPARHFFKVVSGAARCFRVLADGRRQIFQFCLTGDIFGVEAGPTRRATAEAIGPSTLIVAHRSERAGDDTALSPRLWRLAMDDLRRSNDQVLILGRRAASERVAIFLAEMADRLGGEPVFELPMSRQDIADYLGLTIETVSRSFTQLQGQGLISVGEGRCVRLERRDRLIELCA